MMNGTFEQLRAAVCGQAVGDALGVPYEFMPRDTFRCEGMTGYGTHNQPIGTWSDDTSMMLATLDSLIANEWQVNTEDMRERYLAWLSNGAYARGGRGFDCGRTVSLPTVLHDHAQALDAPMSRSAEHCRELPSSGCASSNPTCSTPRLLWTGIRR